MFKMSLLAACIFFASAATAAEADKLATIMEQQRAIAADLDAGKTGDLTPRQVNAVRKAQKEVFALTEDKTSLDQLPIDEQVRLENALERINAEVKGGRVAHEDQNVCWRERKSGSSLKVTRCGTEKERDEAREGARGFLERPRTCGGECGATP